MRSLYALLFCVFFSFTAFSQQSSITYTDILSGKYHMYLAKNPEYIKHQKSYQFATKNYNNARADLDSLRKMIANAFITPYVKENTLYILSLAGNNSTGDVYEYLRLKGMDFALVLNDLIRLSDLYHLDMMVVKSKKERVRAIAWSRNMVEISTYFKHLFEEKKLNESLNTYTRIQQYDKQIDNAFKTFKKNGYRLSGSSLEYESIFNVWQTYEEELRLGKNRILFFKTLEKKYGKPLEETTKD
ncbi:MAG: hypothetical protein AAGI07_16180 [Bacteroidota bacterium]